MKLLSPKDLEARIGVPVSTIERWRATGEGPPFIRLVRRIAYREEDVERWLASRTFTSRAAEMAQRAAAE
jgi:predicted DNA-binding transcriptional regulator AlpA